MNTRAFDEDMAKKGKSPKFAPISVREETFEELERMKGPGKTWDRFIREVAGLPLEAVAA